MLIQQLRPRRLSIQFDQVFLHSISAYDITEIWCRKKENTTISFDKMFFLFDLILWNEIWNSDLELLPFLGFLT